MNPMLQIMNNGGNSNMKNLISQIKAVKNPQTFVQKLLNKNPQLQVFINQCGGPKAAFYQLAQQKGIDPDGMLQQFQNLMK